MHENAENKGTEAGIVTFPLRPGRVLVVDDEENNRRFLKQLLASKGYHVETADTGEAALSAVGDRPPDVLILDVLMPGIDGYEVCRRLKSSQDTAYIHILMFTSLASDEDRIEGIQAGANDFLTKDARPQEILLRVRNAVMAKQAFDDAREEFRELEKFERLRACLHQLTAGNDAVPAALIGFGLQMMRWEADGWSDDAVAALDAATEQVDRLIAVLQHMQ